jgi:hypothetical protein
MMADEEFCEEPLGDPTMVPCTLDSWDLSAIIETLKLGKKSAPH